MPMTDDDVKDLKAMIALAKKGPVNIGICLGKSPEGTIIKMDRKRSPGILAKQAKADGETTRLIAGRIEISGKDATITCAEEPPGTAAKQLKAAFKDFVQISLDFEFVLDPSADIEAEVPEAPPAPAATTAPQSAPSGPDAGKAQWENAWAEVEPKLAALLGKAGAEAAKLTAVRDFALGKVAAGQFDAAVKALASLVQLMASVAKAVSDAKPVEPTPAESAPALDARALVEQLGQLKPQIAALQGPVGVKLTELFQNAVALVKSGALPQAAADLAKITAALGKIAASTAQAAARTAATQTATPAAPPAADVAREEEGRTLQAEVDRLAPLVAQAASQGRVADVNALTTLFNLVAETIPAANHAKAMANLARVEAMLTEGAKQDKTAFEAEVPDDVRPFAASRLNWAATRKTLHAELDKLQKAITEAFSGVEGLEGAVSDLSPLFRHIEKLDERLEDKLDQIVTSQPGPDRLKLRREARGLLDAYAAELSNPFFAEIDQDNGFVSVAVASTARRALADLSKVLAA